ncbi:MAG: GntR family transcriptional regulator [Acidobacteria bacterium]|nr:GntR family transcriptional regulator [Acidobacteriota bacterium]
MASKIDDPGSLTARAYQAIKREILAVHLRPGDPLPVERFIRELRFSKTPVREAILRLEREGLIQIRPRMGTFVAHLDLRQIQEMYEVRSLLEGRAARLTAMRLPVEKLAAVEKQLRAQRTKGEIDCKALSEAGQALHQFMIRSCGNRVLTQMIESVRDHFARFRTLSLDIPEKVLSSHQEHLEILEALKARNPDLVERCVCRHFEHAGRFLMETLLHPEATERFPVTVATAE